MSTQILAKPNPSLMAFAIPETGMGILTDWLSRIAWFPVQVNVWPKQKKEDKHRNTARKGIFTVSFWADKYKKTIQIITIPGEIPPEYPILRRNKCSGILKMRKFPSPEIYFTIKTWTNKNPRLISGGLIFWPTFACWFFRIWEFSGCFNSFILVQSWFSTVFQRDLGYYIPVFQRIWSGLPSSLFRA